MTFRDLRFLLALPFAIVADLCGAWVARQDTKAADAINRPGVDDQ